MVEVYDVSVSAINQHIKRIYDDKGSLEMNIPWTARPNPHITYGSGWCLWL